MFPQIQIHVLKAPPNTNGIDYKDIYSVNFSRDVGSLLLFSGRKSGNCTLFLYAKILWAYPDWKSPKR